MTELKLCPTCGAPLTPGTPPEKCPRCLMQAGFASTGGVGSSSPPPAPSADELAGDFPQLEIGELLGRGGMGVVYKARQKSLDRIVALKLLTVGTDADPAFAERFEREARALATLSHANIVAVYDSGRSGDWYYLVMEFVDGTDLRQMERAGRIEPREALAIVAQVCDALQYAHDRGVVHRDIKPENILVDRKGNVKIADFGLAKLLGAEQDAYALTRSDQAMGTLHYMAPEQVEKPLAVDHRADIFSLGVVFYELLTGELPLGRFAPPSKKIEVDVRVDEVVLKALEKDPPRRYQHASEVKVEVEGIASGAPRSEEEALRVATAAATAAASAVGGQHGGMRVRHVSVTGSMILSGLIAVGALLAFVFVLRAFLHVSPGGISTLGIGELIALAALFLTAVIAGLVFLVKGLGSLGRRSDGTKREAWPFVLAAVVGMILLVPVGCGVAFLGFAFLAPSRVESSESEPFIYGVFDEPARAEPLETEPPELEEPAEIVDEPSEEVPPEEQEREPN